MIHNFDLDPVIQSMGHQMTVLDKYNILAAYWNPVLEVSDLSIDTHRQRRMPETRIQCHAQEMCHEYEVTRIQ